MRTYVSSSSCEPTKSFCCGFARVSVADRNGVDALLRVAVAVLRGAVEALILDDAVRRFHQHRAPNVDVQIPRARQIQRESSLRHRRVLQLRARQQVKRVDHAVAVADGEAQENPVIAKFAGDVRQLAVLHLVIQRHLVVALFVQDNTCIRARCAFRQQIIRVNRRFIFSILIIRVADNQRAAPEVRFGDAELLVIAVRIRRERKLRVAVQRVDILLQIKPQGNRVTQCLDENRLLIFVRRHAGEARQEESSQPPAKVLVVTADGILLGIARVNPSIYASAEK